MPDCMSFPDNIMDFIDDYSFEDSDHVYTNGSKLIPSFRVKQAVEHYFREQEPVEAKTMGESKSHGSWWFACGACGHAIDPEDNFCRECGRAVKWCSDSPAS